MTNLTIIEVEQHLHKVRRSKLRGLITGTEAMSYVQGMKKMLDILGLLDQRAMEVFYDFDRRLLE